MANYCIQNAGTDVMADPSSQPEFLRIVFMSQILSTDSNLGHNLGHPIRGEHARLSCTMYG